MALGLGVLPDPAGMNGRGGAEKQKSKGAEEENKQ
jgi:hypothetical protein